MPILEALIPSAELHLFNFEEVDLDAEDWDLTGLRPRFSRLDPEEVLENQNIVDIEPQDNGEPPRVFVVADSNLNATVFRKGRDTYVVISKP